MYKRQRLSSRTASIRRVRSITAADGDSKRRPSSPNSWSVPRPASWSTVTPTLHSISATGRIVLSRAPPVVGLVEAQAPNVSSPAGSGGDVGSDEESTPCRRRNRKTVARKSEARSSEATTRADLYRSAKEPRKRGAA